MYNIPRFEKKNFFKTKQRHILFSLMSPDTTTVEIGAQPDEEKTQTRVNSIPISVANSSRSLYEKYNSSIGNTNNG